MVQGGAQGLEGAHGVHHHVNRVLWWLAEGHSVEDAGQNASGDASERWFAGECARQDSV
jgi:hypothetical protein